MEVALTELQLAIIRVLWDRGEASIIAIHDELRTERRVAQSTIATLLARLERKNVVARREDGRLHLFRSCVSQKDVQRSVAADSVRKLRRAFLGNESSMVSYLLDAAELDEEDLARARKMLDDRLAEKANADGDEGD